MGRDSTSGQDSQGPGISVLIPTFNGGDFLTEAVQSVVGQLREDDEIVIQDAASTDGSVERMLEAVGHHPGVKVVSEKDDGQADALNRGLARAVNPVVGWLNADDTYEPGALEAARRGFLRDPDANLVYGSFTLFDEHGEVLRLCVPKQLTRAGLMRTPQIFTGAMYMRADTVRAVGGFDASFYYCMDMDLVARLLRTGREPVLVPETLGGFRWYAESKTGGGLGVVKEGLKVRRRYAEGLGQQAEAFFFSFTQAIAQVLLPLRRAKWYSKIRVRKGADAHAVRTGDTTP
jgi:glycosyltransferase involved in cell wall biosynthesis